MLLLVAFFMHAIFIPKGITPTDLHSLYIGVGYTIVSLITLSLYAWDKYLTESRSAWRVPESMLLLAEWAGGAIIGLLVRRVISHKVPGMWFDVVAVIFLATHAAAWFVCRRTFELMQAGVRIEVLMFFTLSLWILALSGLPLCKNKWRFPITFADFQPTLLILALIGIIAASSENPIIYLWGEIPERKPGLVESWLEPTLNHSSDDRMEELRRRYVLGEKD